MSELTEKIDRIDARHETSSTHGEALRTYWIIFWWLMGLLVLTVVAAQIHLDDLAPGLNLLVAMLIATAKGLLVVLFFMHVKQASKLTWVFATAAFVWLAILMFLSFNDYLLRENILAVPRITPDEFRAETQEHVRRDVSEQVSPRGVTARSEDTESGCHHHSGLRIEEPNRSRLNQRKTPAQTVSSAAHA